MSKQHPLNVPWLHFHIREALGELRGLEALLEFLDTGKKPKWLNKFDIDLCCDKGKPRDSFMEIHLCSSLAHAYHHMNFGWNTRRCESTRKADRQFSKNENFPRPSEAGWTFDRYWSERCLKCLKSGQMNRSRPKEAGETGETNDK